MITEGFGDTAAIMRGMKGFGLEESELKNWRHLQKHPSIIERTLVREIPERVDYRGRVMRPLDEEATRRAVRELVAEKVEALAVCLLWCTEHPEHERRVVEIAREEAPELYVSASSDVLPRIGEYSRMMTTAINAYLGPEVSAVTESLDSTLRDTGLPNEPLLMQSNGGLASVRTASDHPVSFLLSGPVGGVVGSRLVAEEIGESNVVTADMGGTSFDVGLVVDGRPLLQRRLLEMEDGGYDHSPRELSIVRRWADVINLVADGDEILVQAAQSGAILGPLGEDWRDAAPYRCPGAEELGPWIRLHPDLEFRQYLDPATGRSLWMDFVRKGDAPVADFRLRELSTTTA